MLSPFAEIVKDCHVCMLVRAIVVNMELPPVRLLLSSRSAGKDVPSLRGGKAGGFVSFIRWH